MLILRFQRHSQVADSTEEENCRSKTETDLIPQIRCQGWAMDNLEIHYKLDMFAVFDIVPHYKGKKFIFGVSY